jgi:uroporphyrinogen decarboxylase
MNPKALFQEALELGTPKPTPASLWGGGAWAFALAGASYRDLVASPDLVAQAITSANEKVGSAVVFVGSGFTNFPMAALGASLEFKEKGAPALVGQAVADLAQVDRLDLDRLDADQALQTLQKAAALVKEAIGATAYVTSISWAPFTFAGRLYGMDRLMTALVDDPKGVEALLERATEAVFRYHLPYLEAGSVDGVAMADPMASGDVISRRHFQQFAQPYLAKVTQRFAERGYPVLLHICGRTDDRLDLIADAGVKGFFLDHRVDLAKALEVVRGRMCIGGNVDPVNVLARGTVDDVVQAARACLETAGDGGGYVLTPGCDIPPDVPLANVQALIRTAMGA